MKLPIPVNVITGPLGAGKSTCITKLVASKPEDSRWCVLVNEFGALGIDEAILNSSTNQPSTSNVVVKQLAGGCMCCALSGPLNVAIAQTIRLTKPDRLIIEPSGLGHPGGLLDVLRSEHLAKVLDVKAVLCLVDVFRFETADYDENPIISNQLDVCDVLIANKCDVADPAVVADFTTWAQGLFPPKHTVLTASQGIIDPALLDLPRQPQHISLINPAAPTSRIRGRGSTTARQHQLGPTNINITMQEQAVGDDDGDDDASEAAQGVVVPELQPGRPVVVPGASSGPYRSCGWLFHQDDVFDRQRLLAVLAQLAAVVLRIKGVFRVGKEWVMLAQASGTGAAELRPICYRRESRVEVLLDAGKKLAAAGRAATAGAGPDAASSASSAASNDPQEVSKASIEDHDEVAVVSNACGQQCSGTESLEAQLCELSVDDAIAKAVSMAKDGCWDQMHRLICDSLAGSKPM